MSKKRNLNTQGVRNLLQQTTSSKDSNVFMKNPDKGMTKEEVNESRKGLHQDESGKAAAEQGIKFHEVIEQMINVKDTVIIGIKNITEDNTTPVSITGKTNKVLPSLEAIQNDRTDDKYEVLVEVEPVETKTEPIVHDELLLEKEGELKPVNIEIMEEQKMGGNVIKLTDKVQLETLPIVNMNDEVEILPVKENPENEISPDSDGTKFIGGIDPIDSIEIGNSLPGINNESFKVTLDKNFFPTAEEKRKLEEEWMKAITFKELEEHAGIKSIPIKTLEGTVLTTRYVSAEHCNNVREHIYTHKGEMITVYEDGVTYGANHQDSIDAQEYLSLMNQMSKQSKIQFGDPAKANH